MSTRIRPLRLAGLAALVWFAAECLLVYAASASFGALPVFAFLTLKGLGGLALLAIALRSILRSLGRNALRRGLSATGDAIFAALGAALIALPGFLATFAGVALFSPSVRMAVLRRLKSGRKGRTGERVVTLDRTEWREIRVRRRSSPEKRRSIAP